MRKPTSTSKSVPKLNAVQTKDNKSSGSVKTENLYRAKERLTKRTVEQAKIKHSAYHEKMDELVTSFEGNTQDMTVISKNYATEDYSYTHMLTYAETPSEIDYVKASSTNSLISGGKIAGYRVLVNTSGFEAIQHATTKEIRYVPARKTVTQVRSLMVQASAENFKLVLETGVPVIDKSEPNNPRAVILKHRKSTAVNGELNAYTPEHHFSTTLGRDQSYERVTFALGDGAEYTYSVFGAYSVRISDTADKVEADPGYINFKLTARETIRDIVLPAGFSYITSPTIMLQRTTDPSEVTNPFGIEEAESIVTTPQYDISYFAAANNHAVSMPLDDLWPKPTANRLYKVSPPVMVNIAVKTGDIPQPLPYRYARCATMNAVDKDNPRMYFFRTVNQSKSLSPASGFLTAAVCTMEGLRTITPSYEDGKSFIPVRNMYDYINKDRTIKVSPNWAAPSSFRSNAVSTYSTDDDPEHPNMTADSPIGTLRNIIQWVGKKQ